jgi:uncharacterized damage-inducible protein DinB
MTKTKTLTLCLMFALGAAGRAHAAAPAAKETLQNDLVKQMDDVEKKLVDLLDAEPQDKLKWMPAPGVRSVAEVYLHVAYGNYGLTKMITGKAPPATANFTGDAKKWDAQTTDKAAIKKILLASFDWVKDGIKSVPEKDLDKKVSFFGHDMSTRAAMMVVANHDSEHLGQSIAYARANKVTPPWSKSE